MDWKIFFATFCTIFVAELGDKTQLANLSLAAESGSRISVFSASVAAYGVATLIAVCLGTLLNRSVRPEYLKYGTASLFIVIGLLMLLGKI